MVAVNEALGRTIVPGRSHRQPEPADARRDGQRPPARGGIRPLTSGAETISAIGISEPGAGADPAGMKTTAVRDGDDWILNGRKIWITKANVADFTITMAVTDKVKGARGGISAFLVDKDAPWFHRRAADPGHRRGDAVRGRVRRLPRRGLEAARHRRPGLRADAAAPRQARRAEMAANAIGMAQRAMEMMIDYAPQRRPSASRCPNARRCRTGSATPRSASTPRA
ncbi:acyl-CoA dehydrogenase family protein [Sphingomonas sp. MMS24-JH45]